MEPEAYCLFLFQSSDSSFFSLQTLALIGAILLEILLLGCSALISSSEVAFFSLSSNDFHLLRDENSPPGNRILKLKEKPRTLLATILIANNFINIAIVLLSEFLIQNFIPDTVMRQWATSLVTLIGWEASTVASMEASINFSITVVGVTFLLVLFGEVAPKIYAKLNNIRLAKFMSGPLIFLIQALSPFSKFLVKGTNLIERRLEKRRTSSSANVTSREEIDEAIELTVKHEKNSRQEIDILKSIVKFGDITVKQIMRSRVDIIAVDVEESFHELLRIVRESGHSRIPVYKEEMDQITGILYVKDLIGYMNEPDDFAWQALINSNVMYVPEAKKINDMLREFQASHLHMAIVVDEYGGTSGLVTLEDILEEVIGDIRGEFDHDEELEFQKLDDRNYIIEGKTLLKDVCRLLQIHTNTFDDVRGDSDSLAGLVLELAGFLPKKGDQFYYNEFKFKVVSVNRRRVEQVHITLPEL